MNLQTCCSALVNCLDRRADVEMEVVVRVSGWLACTITSSNLLDSVLSQAVLVQPQHLSSCTHPLALETTASCSTSTGQPTLCHRFWLLGRHRCKSLAVTQQTQRSASTPTLLHRARLELSLSVSRARHPKPSRWFSSFLLCRVCDSSIL